VPWEIDEGLYGVACTTAEGREGADLIGKKAEAEAVVQAITDQKIGVQCCANPHRWLRPRRVGMLGLRGVQEKKRAIGERPGCEVWVFMRTGREM